MTKVKKGVTVSSAVGTAIGAAASIGIFWTLLFINDRAEKKAKEIKDKAMEEARTNMIDYFHVHAGYSKDRPKKVELATKDWRGITEVHTFWVSNE